MKLPVILLALSAPVSLFANWPQFRGPNCSGVADGATPPVKIGPTENLAWKVAVPWSPSSPCVWGERIYLTTFSGGKLEVRAHSAADGSLLWSRPIEVEKLELFHRSDGSPAASTPATDGVHLVSYFGSFGLICHDTDGKELWRHPLPVAESGGGFGSGTSPIIAGGLVILCRDLAQGAVLLAFDVKSGAKQWETNRPDSPASFGTPIIWKNEGRDEVITPGSLRLKSYELTSGKERWKLEGVASFACTTPVVGNGMLYFAAWSPGKADAPWPSWDAFLGKSDKNGDGVAALDEFDESDRDFARGMDADRDGMISKADFERILEQTRKGENVLLAIKPHGAGDITESHIVWKANRGLPYVPSPLYYDGRIYLAKDGGMLSCFDAATGKPAYVQERLDAIGSYYASPVAAGGHLYIASLPGKLSIVKASGDKPAIVHQAEFGERIFATPALAGKRLYLRTAEHLWAFQSGD